MQGEPPLSNSHSHVLAQVQSGARTSKLGLTGSQLIPGMPTIAWVFLVSP